jgi:GTP cyclohydrolase I
MQLIIPARTIETSQIAEEAVRDLLIMLGENPDRPGLVDTPQRVRRSLADLTCGYAEDPREVAGRAIFEEQYDEMVVVKDIELYSLCEHHLLPFFGKAHVAYLPNGRIVGLSKLPRLVEIFSRRLQVQERLTVQVADFLMERLVPKGVACVVEASHLCTMMRGVKKQEATMVTSSMLGTFRRDPRTRAEFMGLIGKGGSS